MKDILPRRRCYPHLQTGEDVTALISEGFSEQFVRKAVKNKRPSFCGQALLYCCFYIIFFFRICSLTAT